MLFIIPTDHPTTQFDHHSVSVPAIRTNQLFANHHFVIGVYEYCPAVHQAIPEKTLLAFGSVGILFIPAEIRFHEIRDKDHAAVGNCHLSIWYETNAAAT